MDMSNSEKRIDDSSPNDTSLFSALQLFASPSNSIHLNNTPNGKNAKAKTSKKTSYYQKRAKTLSKVVKQVETSLHTENDHTQSLTLTSAIETNSSQKQITEIKSRKKRLNRGRRGASKKIRLSEPEKSTETQGEQNRGNCSP
jgi:hypothetical protein